MDTHSNTRELDDYRWLVSSEGRSYLQLAATDAASLFARTKSLRRELSPQRTHLVLQQVELRQRAQVKFHRAHEMFFTRQALEQATDETIAAYKADRLANRFPVADLCCGIGGDLTAMARRGPTLGVDRDRIVALLASENCQSLGVTRATVRSSEVCDIEIKSLGAWHIDPDRRPCGRRTTRPELYRPSIETIQQLIARNENAAIKLAATADAPQRWSCQAEREWIGDRRECKQQVAWLGNLAHNPGRRVATVLIQGEWRRQQVIGQPDVSLEHSSTLGRYLFEPYPAVLAARLQGELARRHGLAAITPRGAYLTADERIDNQPMRMYEIIEVMPFDVKHLKSWLHERRIGRLEIKKRGVNTNLARLRSQLALAGEELATLILCRHHSRVIAIFAR